MKGASRGLRRRLYLVRHAEVEYFQEGKPLDPRFVSLSPKGIEQARALAQCLSGLSFDRVLCSDLPRARETAQILIAGRNLPLEERAAFREIRAGRLREISRDRLEQQIAYAFEGAGDPEGRFIGGEKFSEFQKRVLCEFQGLLADPGWRSLLLVSHDGINRVLLCWAAGAGLSAMAAFEQDPGCLNVVDVDWEKEGARRRFIRLVNFTPYDPAKAQLFVTSMERVYRAYYPGHDNGQY